MSPQTASLFMSLLLFSVASVLSQAAQNKRTESCEQFSISAGQNPADAHRLCRGASNNGPALCYGKATCFGLGPKSENILLCQCANSVAPAECDSHSQHDLKIGILDAYRLCEEQKWNVPTEIHCMEHNGPTG